MRIVKLPCHNPRFSMANAPVPEGFMACVAGTHELCVDYKGLLSLPYDTENDGMKCARGLIFLTGRAVHVPDMAGQYVTTGQYAVVSLPCLVHFTGDRKPELCTALLDFAATNCGLAGVVVESLTLPLKLAGKDKYRSLPNMTQADTIVGFSPVPTGETSIHLKETLKGIAPFKQFGVHTYNEVVSLVGKPLAARVTKLKDHALARILAQVTELAKFDRSAAAQQQGLWTARLEWIISIVNKFPPINYDARIVSRVTVLEVNNGEQLGHRPDWLASPLKKQLMQGAAGALQRSQFVEKHADGAAAAAAAAAQEPGAGDAAAAAAAGIKAAAEDFGPEQFYEEMDGDDDDDIRARVTLVEDGDGDNSDVARDDAISPDMALPTSRRRKAPATYVPPGTTPKRAKASADKPKPAKCSDSINPRTSAPYKRGPYTTTRQPVSLPKVPVDGSVTTKKLRDELAAALAKIKDLQIELELEKRTSANNVLSAKNDMLAKMSYDAMGHFMRGLNHGSRLSGGTGIILSRPSFLPSVGSTSSDT